MRELSTLNASALLASFTRTLEDLLESASIRELGGGVLTKVMVCARVPEVVSRGGPGGLVDGTDCGVVPRGNGGDRSPRFTGAREGYVADRARRLDHPEAADERAIEHFSWDEKARKLHDVYEWEPGQRCSKPVFGERPLATPRPVSAGLDMAAHGT